MAKVVQINIVCNGSTGKIMREIQVLANENDYETLSIYGRGKGFKDLNCKKFGNVISFLYHVLITFIFNKHNHASYFQTKKLVKFLKKYEPDIIHLHNIHGYYLNNNVLFKYLKNDYQGKIIWNLHDCWAFTGHCSHYESIKCDKWQNECNNCSQKGVYPYSWFFDTSYKEFKHKQKLYTGIRNLTIVVPSMWLKKQVEHSFLKDYPCMIINHGIDLNLFKPTINYDIYTKYNIPKNKKIILGVANVWAQQKGYDTFLKLSKLISNDEIIVMVGLNKKQINKLPKNIIGIERTENVEDLISLYSISDVFFNPSIEETFSLVTIEAMACGVPCLVYNSTATPELITGKVGIVIDNYSIENIYANIKKLLNKDYKLECIKRAKKYDKKNYQKYIDLYNQLVKNEEV